MYLYNLYNDLKEWFIIYKVGKNHKQFLNDNNIRRDWIGRLYTVINLPEEIATNTYARDPYVNGKLKDFDDILMTLQLNDLIYPELSLIPDTDSYLLVMQGNRERLNFWSILKNSIFLVILFFALKIGYNFLDKNHIIPNVISWFQKYI